MQGNEPLAGEGSVGYENMESRELACDIEVRTLFFGGGGKPHQEPRNILSLMYAGHGDLIARTRGICYIVPFSKPL